MPLFRKNKKPQPGRPPVDLTWRRPASKPPMTDSQRFEELMGYFDEDGLTFDEARIARDRREHV